MPPSNMPTSPLEIGAVVLLQLTEFFRASDFGFRVSSLGFRVLGLGFRDSGSQVLRGHFLAAARPSPPSPMRAA